MKLRHPPKLAAWLLRCSGIAAQNSPLAGDLIEEFQHGRSSAWFWRQTLKAIAIGAVQDCRTLGSYGVAIFTGWAIQASIVLALWTFHEPRKLSDSMSWWMLSFTIIIAAASLKAWASQKLSLLYLDKMAWQKRKLAMWALVALSRIVVYLFVYCLMALALTHQMPFERLILWQMLWLWAEISHARKRIQQNGPA